MSKRSNNGGVTVLTAAMRCYVASKLGDEVKLPGDVITAFVIRSNK